MQIFTEVMLFVLMAKNVIKMLNEHKYLILGANENLANVINQTMFSNIQWGMWENLMIQRNLYYHALF